jgi:selenide,water dikinase
MLGKRVVLIGGGHAHVQLLGKFDPKLHNVTLISDALTAGYSGMLPWQLAGQYSTAQLSFDLRDLCQRYGHKLIGQAAVAIDGERKTVTLKDQKELTYDVCSIDVGIVPRELPIQGDSARYVYVKPVASFLGRWQAATARLRGDERILIIGSGAGAFELAIALGIRYPDRVKLLTSLKGLALRAGVAPLARDALCRHGVTLIEGETVEQYGASTVTTNRRTIDFDLAVVATSAAPTELITRSQLPKDSEGHVQVDEFLRVTGFEDLFAVGDCAHFLNRPIPKAGVYAVRQGPVLRENILARLRGEASLRRYRPQSRVLSLLISGADEAILNWGPVVLRGRWIAALKRFIDRRFMERFS